MDEKLATAIDDHTTLKREVQEKLAAAEDRHDKLKKEMEEKVNAARDDHAALKRGLEKKLATVEKELEDERQKAASAKAKHKADLKAIGDQWNLVRMGREEQRQKEEALDNMIRAL